MRTILNVSMSEELKRKIQKRAFKEEKSVSEFVRDSMEEIVGTPKLEKSQKSKPKAKTKKSVKSKVQIKNKPAKNSKKKPKFVRLTDEEVNALPREEQWNYLFNLPHDDPQLKESRGQYKVN